MAITWPWAHQRPIFEARQSVAKSQGGKDRAGLGDVPGQDLLASQLRAAKHRDFHRIEIGFNGVLMVFQW